MSWRKGERPSRRQWGKLRLLVFDRDGWACVKCGKAGRLECDHRVPLDLAPDKMYDLGNLQTLCRGCHFDKTSGERRGKETDTEAAKWRKYLLDKLPAIVYGV